MAIPIIFSWRTVLNVLKSVNHGEICLFKLPSEIDGIDPDRYDIIGGIICLIGIFVLMYWPRS